MKRRHKNDDFHCASRWVRERGGSWQEGGRVQRYDSGREEEGGTDEVKEKAPGNQCEEFSGGLLLFGSPA